MKEKNNIGKVDIIFLWQSSVRTSFQTNIMIGHRVQRRVGLSGQFFRIFHIIFRFVADICDLVYDVEAIIMKTCPCNENPLTPHFYIGKLGFTRVYFFSYFCSITLILVYALSKNKKNITFFSSENYHFYSNEILKYIAWTCLHNDLACVNCYQHLEIFSEIWVMLAISGASLIFQKRCPYAGSI